MLSTSEDSYSLFKSWKTLNDMFIFPPPQGFSDQDFLIAGRDLPKGREFSSMTYGMELGGKGFGLPEEQPFVGVDRRVKLLRGRYVDPPLWQEALDRLDSKKKKLGGPMSYVFPFHRPPKSAPTGGGCLISITLTWYRKSWRIHVMSRASEITIRLLGDMYFIQSMVNEIFDQVGPLKNWPENPPINWTILMCSQMKHVVPYYLMHTRSEEFVRDYMISKPTCLRHQGFIDYFWELIIHPERITWAQRRRWSEKFMEDANLDWEAIEKSRCLQSSGGSRIIEVDFADNYYDEEEE